MKVDVQIQDFIRKGEDITLLGHQKEASSFIEFHFGSDSSAPFKNPITAELNGSTICFLTTMRGSGNNVIHV